VSENNEDFVAKAKRLLKIEANAVERCGERIGKSFILAIEMLKNCADTKNKIVLLGMGKSHYVAAKLSASFMSTGMTSVFVHPAEAFHGDLGILNKGDVCIFISKSGNTAELVSLLPFLRINCKIITITGNLNSTLAEKSDVALDASVEKEACPINLLPTSSTTTALALGDALVSVLAEYRGFDKQTFAGFHPGGSIGKRLNQRIEDVYLKLDKVPFGDQNLLLPELAEKMSQKPVGAFCVVDSTNQLIGVVTDGDIRRSIVKGNTDRLKAAEVMNKNPVALQRELLVDDALAIMEQADKKILCAPVVDNHNKLIGIVRLHDLI
jgi:arabinose-5-phosphate isomerase